MSLSYPASFGDQTKTIEISQVSGTGGQGTWHVTVDRYLVATITEIDHELRVRPVHGNWMTGDDISALTEVFEWYLG